MSTVADPQDSDTLDGRATLPRQAGSQCSRSKPRGLARLRCSWNVVGWTLLIGGVHLLLARHPVYHTDVWGHLAYGRWIAEHGRLPQSEPLLPLSAGVPMIDTAWLSQVVGYAMYRQFGVTSVQFLYAAPITLAFALLLWGVLRRTGRSVIAGLVALGTFGWVNYQQLLIVRPQLNGLMMFVALLVLMNTCRRRSVLWIVVPLMFAAWANLHGSWIVGLTLLAAMCVGHAIDLVRRTGSLGTALSAGSVRRLAALGGVAAVAVLLTPYGVRLYEGVFAISGNPNLQPLVEWQPLTLRMSQGRAAAAAVLGLMFAWRVSPRRVTTTEVLLLIGLGGAALWSSRMLHWWAPVSAWYLALHAAAITRRFCPRPRRETTRSGMAAAVCVVTASGLLLASPFGMTLLRGQPETPGQRAALLVRSTSPQTPLGAAAYLCEHPPAGLVYNTYEWGDFLLFAGPRNVELFTNSHAHLVPRPVWLDGLVIHRARAGWRQRLDQYAVKTLVLNRHRNTHLIRALRRTGEWEIAYQDHLAIIFHRRDPMPGRADATDRT
jgi:hypothetical protein